MKPDFEVLFDLYCAQRLTTRQIAQQFDTNKTQVLRWLKAYGIERREANNGLLHRGITPPTRDELFYLVHEEHLGYREIAAQFGVDHTAVSYWLKKYAIPRPSIWDTRYKGKRPELPSREELVALYESGMSLDDIGELFQTSQGVMRRLCRDFGVQVNPDGWGQGKRFLCQDGHLVRSMYEQRIDDWLFAHHIPHTYEPPLPGDRRYKADFLANGWYIEIWGVTNNATYEQRCQQKRQLYQQHSYPLIELGRDFFSTRRQKHLEQRLQQVLIPPPQTLLSTVQELGEQPPYLGL